ncbi:MAG TPA: hypothetical protein PLC48_00450 [Ferruginibacter sp.]|jgi:hypothetical protein|nr:hypothetical protein [Ferruginibacter sp.]
MNKSNRDLLVLFKQELMTPQAIEHEVMWLHELLFTVERLDNFVSAHEIIDLNKYKLSNKPFDIKKLVRRKREQPFVFLNNKN